MGETPERRGRWACFAVASMVLFPAACDGDDVGTATPRTPMGVTTTATVITTTTTTEITPTAGPSSTSEPTSNDTVPPPITSFATVVLQEGFTPAAPIAGAPTWRDRLNTPADPAGDGDSSRIIVVAFTAPESWYRSDGAAVFAWADGEGAMFGYSTGAFQRVEPFEFPVDPTKSSVLEIWLVSDAQSDAGRRLLTLEVGLDDPAERRTYRTIDPSLSITDVLSGPVPEGGDFLERT
ncbi:MAG: hypothetical protein R8G01_05610 [Ilumatobacteraceae bacterium]|nr:hypothetical protein [Ilumatobacteraceae bacterium]